MGAREIGLLVALGTLAVARCCFAVDAEQPLDRFRLTSCNVGNGLPSEVVDHVVQTPDGYLWLSDETRVFCFGGKRFTELEFPDQRTVPNRPIGDLKVGRNGELWIASAGTIYCRDLNGAISRYDSTNGVPAGMIDCLSINRDGSLCFGTRFSGAFLLAGDRCRPIWSAPTESHDKAIKAIRELDDQTSLIATERAVIRFNRITGETKTTELGGTFAGSAITALVNDHAGNIWCGTQSELLRLDEDRFVREDPGTVHGALSLYEDASGALWIGSSEGQVFRKKAAGIEAINVGQEGEKPNVLDFCEDAEGNLWIGSDGGLQSVSEAKFSVFTSRDGLPNRIATAVAPGSGNTVWVGTPNGLVMIRGGRVTRPELDSGARNLDKEVNCVHEDPTGAVWFGTADGHIYKLSGRVAKEIVTPPFGGVHHPVGFADDGKGTVWASVVGWGVIQMRGDQVERTFTPAEGLKSAGLAEMLFLHDELWISSDRGINVLREGRILSAPPSPPGNPTQSFAVIHADSDGVIWAGTMDRGLQRFLNGQWARRYCGSSQGLPASDVRGIQGDELGNLWFSSSRGIFMVSKDQLNQFFDGAIDRVDCRRFDRSDGLKSVRCKWGHYPSICRTLDGKIAFPTMNGVAIVDPKHIPWNLRTPQMHIEKLVVNDTQQIPLRGSDKFTLNPRTFSLGFSYAGISLSAPEKVQYRYRLDGFEKDWTNAGIRNEVFYTNLPPGNYRFRVIACNNDGVWVPESAAATVEFAILPHFYQTIWFYQICAAALVGFIWMLYKWRVHQVLLERSRLAREFHDTLAQSFVALIWQIERAKSYAGPSVPEAAFECLDRAMDHAREGLSEARRAVHALRAGVLDESEDFPSAVRILLQPETAGASLASHLSVVGKPYQLSKEWEQALIRILQEGINNAIKHAKAKRFDVHLEFRKHEVRFRMRDDGKGFTMNESAGEMAPAKLRNPHFSSGLGLIGMRERCLRLGGKFSIHSSPGQGTSIEIIAPKRRFGWFTTPLSSLGKNASRRRIIKSKLRR